MADLTDFYPTTVQASPRGDGMPANPGAVTRGGSMPVSSGSGSSVGDHMKTPSLWVLVFVAAGFFLLHKT